VEDTSGTQNRVVRLNVKQQITAGINAGTQRLCTLLMVSFIIIDSE
jgi:hypothetical protein